MTLKQLKQVQFIARANGWNDNVAATVLVTKSDTEMVTEEQLLKALESKYDVMRDKLLAEVRPLQFCCWTRDSFMFFVLFCFLQGGGGQQPQVHVGDSWLLVLCRQ